MEPLSVTASVITVLQAAEAVISVCCNYRSAVAGSSWEVPRILEATRNLRNVLRILEEIADKAETRAKGGVSDLPALAEPCNPKTGSLVQCLEILLSLEKRLTPPSWSGPKGSKRSNMVQALTWPLKKAETEKILEKIEGFKSTLNLAVSLDQTSMVVALRDITLENSANTRRKDILAWLNGSDTTTRYANALKGRYPGTGSWYINSEAFDRWTKEPNSTSWLWGIPGCGKTVLSTTIIERLMEMCSHDQDFALVYFYFAFGDQASQSVDGLIRSLITQLCAQSTSIPHCVEALYNKCSKHRSQPTPPSDDSLRIVLSQLFGCFKEVYVVLDALDECIERHDLILALEGILTCQRPELHLLATSRRELELEEFLNTITKGADRIGIQGMPVEADINSYVRGRLCTDRRLKRWHKSELEKEIATTLTSKAHGMYVSADPAILLALTYTLARCRSVSELRGALQSLPKDLDDTYARILKAIDDEGHYTQVFKILQLLIGSNEPVPVDEAAETITIELDNTPRVDLDRRLIDSDDVLPMCSALVILEEQKSGIDGKNRVLRLAHFSIQEYLLSTRIRESTVSHWQMDNISCHLSIARLFIAYILFLEVDSDAIPDWPWTYRQLNLEYPLAATAISRWPEHLSIAENNDVNHVCGDLGSQLFTTHSAAKRSWITLSIYEHCGACNQLFFHDINQWAGDFGIRRDSLAFTAHHNLPQTTRSLITRGANPDILSQSRPEYDIKWVTPLAEASRSGYIRVVKELLDSGADVRFESDGCPNALKQACRDGNTEVVRLLLEHGADPSASLPDVLTPLGEALHANSYRGTVDSNSQCSIEHTLLKAGANTTVPSSLRYQRTASGWFPIEWAVLSSCDTSVIKILLDYGGNGVDGLMAACYINYPKIVSFCLEHGTDVNARASISQVALKDDDRSWAGRTALETACTRYSSSIVRMLLDHGADPNLRSPLIESALEAYLNRPYSDLECDAAPIFVLLLRHGADLGLVREDNLGEYGKSKYRVIMDRWKAWKADGSISPSSIIGEYHRKCPDGCACAEVRNEAKDSDKSDNEKMDVKS
ncbi:MAG: hypothetical protein Q9204_003224, partial [Flavoplaca sp. TL-2023a]